MDSSSVRITSFIVSCSRRLCPGVIPTSRAYRKTIAALIKASSAEPSHSDPRKGYMLTNSSRHRTFPSSKFWNSSSPISSTTLELMRMKRVALAALEASHAVTSGEGSCITTIWGDHAMSFGETPTTAISRRRHSLASAPYVSGPSFIHTMVFLSFQMEVSSVITRISAPVFGFLANIYLKIVGRV